MGKVDFNIKKNETKSFSLTLQKTQLQMDQGPGCKMYIYPEFV